MSVSPPEVRLARYPEAMDLLERGEADERLETALAMVGAGLRGVDIAAELGVARSTIYQNLNDPLDIKAQVRKAKTVGTCVDCAGPTFNSGSPTLPKRCRDCARINATHRGAVRVIEAIHDWVRRYGRQPTALDWNLAMAENSAHPERLAQIRAAHRARSWPTVSRIQSLFGSWSGAIKAAGLRPLPPSQRLDPETHSTTSEGKDAHETTHRSRDPRPRGREECTATADAPRGDRGAGDRARQPARCQEGAERRFALMASRESIRGILYLYLLSP